MKNCIICTSKAFHEHQKENITHIQLKSVGAVVAQLVQVAGSIPDDAIGFFHWHNPIGRTMVLGSTQPLTEMSTRNISWGVNVAGEYG
jgi:hypothetical protein